MSKCEIELCDKDAIEGEKYCSMHNEISKSVEDFVNCECEVLNCHKKACREIESRKLCKEHYEKQKKGVKPTIAQDQCIEMGCTEKANHILFGLKLCDIHYKKYLIQFKEANNPPECEEHGCVRKATKVFNGRKVCDDHYDYYRDNDILDTFDIINKT